jgi:hypothetical protein
MREKFEFFLTSSSDVKGFHSNISIPHQRSSLLSPPLSTFANKLLPPSAFANKSQPPSTFVDNSPPPSPFVDKSSTSSAFFGKSQPPSLKTKKGLYETFFNTKKVSIFVTNSKPFFSFV